MAKSDATIFPPNLCRVCIRERTGGRWEGGYKQRSGFPRGVGFLLKVREGRQLLKMLGILCESVLGGQGAGLQKPKGGKH